VKFIGKAYVLSIQKFSSNVIEKCLDKANEFIVTKFVEEFCMHTRIIGINNIFIIIIIE
jgi:hypothetical protein